MIYNFAHQKKLDFSLEPIIMGIVNVTPDSFSGDGIYKSLDETLYKIEAMIDAGAKIIDIGGESTRPDATQVETQEELDRVMPIVEACVSQFDTIVSIDTYKSIVALEATKVGANIINDISGFKKDPKIIEVAAITNSTYIYTFCGAPSFVINGNHDTFVRSSLLENCRYEFSAALETLNRVGVKQIILDIGLGFNKTLSENYLLLKNLSQFKSFNMPLMVGLSRKSMIGKVINDDDRLPSTLALNALAINNGASIIRVHDVLEHASMIKVLKKYFSV